MSINEINIKIETLKEWEAIAAEASAMVESIKDEIKRHMDAQGLEELEAGTHILEVSFICVTLCTPWIGHPQYIQVWDLLLISFPHSGQLINATLLHSFLHGIFTFENIHIIHDSCPKDNYIHTKINQYDTCDRYTIRGLECGCGGLWTKIKRASSTSGHDAATACTAHGCDEVCSFLL